MGNTIGVSNVQATQSFNTFLATYPQLLNKELLSDTKLFKTYSFLCEGESQIIMKVHFKLNNASLKGYTPSLSFMQKEFNLNVYPNLLPYTSLTEEPNFAVLIRPKVYMTLSHRIWTVPMLTLIEKHWIMFQLITAVYNLHNLGLYHGEISSNNVLLTTWNHVFLADFAWYAPNYFLEDKIADVKYYYPSAERKCNLAPEKFIPKDYKDIASLQWNQEQVGKLSPKTLSDLKRMDIFSLGCVMAELLLDGTPLFSYEELLAYRRNEYYPTEKLQRIEDINLRGIIENMIQKNPEKRMDIGSLLAVFHQSVVPESFSRVIYHINSSLISHNFILPDQRIALIRQLLEPIYTDIIGEPLVKHYEPLPVPIQQSYVIQHFSTFYQMVKPNFYSLFKLEKPEFFKRIFKEENSLEFSNNNITQDLQSLITKALNKAGEIPMQLPGKVEKTVSKVNLVHQSDLILIAIIVCSNIRHVKYFPSVLVGLEMLKNFCKYFSDHVKLHIIIPYLFSLLDARSPKVMVSAFNTACSILWGMKKPVRANSDTQLFEDYIFPNLLKMFNSQDVDAKKAFVERMHELVEISTLFISEGLKLKHKKSTSQNNLDENGGKDNKENKEEMFEEIKIIQEDEEEIDNIIDSAKEPTEDLENEIAKRVDKMKALFIELTLEIVSSPQQEINEAFFENFSKLAFALGPEFTEDGLVPHIISALNTITSRYASLKELEKVIGLLKGETVDNIFKPMLEECMFDMNEMIVLQSLRNIVKGVKLKKMIMDDTSHLIKKYLPLVIHPNGWIREEVTELICLVINDMDPVDFYVNFRPSLQKYLKNYDETMPVNAELLRLMLIEPITRPLFDDVRSDGAIELVKNHEMRDLVTILAEQFLDNIPSEFELEVGGNKEEGEPVLRKEIIRDFGVIVEEFYRQTELNNIKSICFHNYNQNLSEKIRMKVHSGHFDPSKSEALVQDTGRILTQISGLKDQFKYSLPTLLMQHRLSIATYIKNLHNFSLISNSILSKISNIQNKKKHKFGHYERYERVSHLEKGWQPHGFLIKTIYEHTDAVTCLDASMNAKLFASGGEDGEVKIFDINKIEADFTCYSVFRTSAKPAKINSVKFLDDDSFIIGTNTGITELYRVQDMEKGKKCLKRWERDGEIKGIAPLVLGNNQREKSFIYVTHKGELGIQSPNEDKVSLKYNFGTEKGMINTMLMSAMDYTVIVGTDRGYVMLYDLRANAVIGSCQLSNEAPILSLANYHPIHDGPLSAQETMTAVSFGSNYHEVGFWDFNKFENETLSPELYFYALPNAQVECRPAYMKDMKKMEPLFQVKNVLKDKIDYSYMSRQPKMSNISQLFDDPMIELQGKYNEKRFSGLGQRGSRYKNSVHKIVSTPSFSSTHMKNSITWHKDLQNIVFTAGNDTNIRYWNLTEEQYYQIYNADGRRRDYKVLESDYTVYKEVIVGGEGMTDSQKKESEYKMLMETGHLDRINDLLVLEKNEMIVSCSRDKTIKIWK